MTITIQLWMIILSLGGFVFPDAQRINFSVLDQAKVETMSFIAQKKKAKWTVKFIDKGQGKQTAIAHFSHRDGQLDWTLNFGDNGMTKTVDLGSRIAGFGTLIEERSHPV